MLEQQRIVAFFRLVVLAIVLATALTLCMALSSG